MQGNLTVFQGRGELVNWVEFALSARICGDWVPPKFVAR